MEGEPTDPVFDAFRAASERGVMPTALDTAGLRELSADLRSRMVFTARGTSAVYVSKIKEVVDKMSSGEMDDASARVALLDTLRAIGYTPEGGFPDAPAGSVPPAVAGSIQDLSSFRRLDLIVRTQRELMQGKGLMMRAHTPERLAQFPAFEVYTLLDTDAPRDWAARWSIAGGRLYGHPEADTPEGATGRMIALKGDPVWGELGSSGNFDDALDVDYPPFYFRSGKWLREVPVGEVKKLGVTGPGGETVEEWQASQPVTMTGRLSLPSPALSMKDLDPEIAAEFVRETKATEKPSKPGVFDYSDLLRDELAMADESYKRRKEGGDE